MLRCRVCRSQRPTRTLFRHSAKRETFRGRAVHSHKAVLGESALKPRQVNKGTVFSSSGLSKGFELTGQSAQHLLASPHNASAFEQHVACHALHDQAVRLTEHTAPRPRTATTALQNTAAPAAAAAITAVQLDHNPSHAGPVVAPSTAQDTRSPWTLGGHSMQVNTAQTAAGAKVVGHAPALDDA